MMCMTVPCAQRDPKDNRAGTRAATSCLDGWGLLVLFTQRKPIGSLAYRAIVVTLYCTTASLIICRIKYCYFIQAILTQFLHHLCGF